MTRPTKILLVDDHPIFRRGVCVLLNESGIQCHVDEAGDGETALALVRREQWDMIILDVALPDRHGLEVLRQIKELRPLLPVLMLTLYPEREFAIRALKAGAAGYVTKEQAPSELLCAISSIQAGHRYITSSLAEQLASYLVGGRRGRTYDRLSNREMEVLRLFGQGKTVSTIAEGLALSVKTVSTYRSRLLEKLRLSTTAELVRYAIQHGLTA